MGYPTGIDPVLPVSQTRVQATTLRTPRAGILGFEPRLTQSKCAVLPLHYIPSDHIEAHCTDISDVLCGTINVLQYGGCGETRTHDSRFKRPIL